MAFSVTPSNMVLGPCAIYLGAFGATEPTDANVATDPSTGWTNAGSTLGGATWTVEEDFTNLMADQIVDPAGARMTARSVTVATSFAEPTLANLKAALNGGTVTLGSAGAPNTYDPDNTATVMQTGYQAVILDGYAPGGPNFRRRLILRKALSTDSVALAYQKDGQTVIPVTFTGYYVSNSTAPFHVVDQTA